MKNPLSLLQFVLPAFLFFGCNGDDPVDVPESLPDNHVSAIYITDDGTKYFATSKGLASFDGSTWTIHHDNPKITAEAIHDLDFELTSYGPEFWLGTNEGVNVITLPVDATSGATTYTRSSSRSLFPGQPGLAGDSVMVVRVDDRNIRWFGTHEGLSAFQGDRWPVINMNNQYHINYFKDNRITAIDHANDTIYIGTKGGGVARMVVTATDAITGASPYEIPWSLIPSENILAVFTDGSTQWYGSDEGIARHIGTQAKENWTLFAEADGLVNNHVQAIDKGHDGLLWFGTKGGVSAFDETNWTNYTTANGLVANNVLCIAIDIDGSIWFGTDNGVSHFDGDKWTSYQAD